MEEPQRIADQLYRAYEGDAWHGPSVFALLHEVHATQATTHPLPQTHSIWEIVLHLITWNDVIVRRLQGEACDPTPQEDWPPVPEPQETAWQQTKEHLLQSYRRLHRAVLQLPSGHLEATTPGKPYANYVLLHGALQHALYHAGQVALLRKAAVHEGDG